MTGNILSQLWFGGERGDGELCVLQLYQNCQLIKNAVCEEISTRCKELLEGVVILVSLFFSSRERRMLAATSLSPQRCNLPLALHLDLLRIQLLHRHCSTGRARRLPWALLRPQQQRQGVMKTPHCLTRLSARRVLLLLCLLSAPRSPIRWKWLTNSNSSRVEQEQGQVRIRLLRPPHQEEVLFPLSTPPRCCTMRPRAAAWY